MEFRWIAVVALWTLLVGPVFDNTRKPSARAVNGHSLTKIAATAPALPLTPRR